MIFVWSIIWSIAKKSFSIKNTNIFTIIPFFQGNGGLVSGIPSFRRPPDDGREAAVQRPGGAPTPRTKPEGGVSLGTGHEKGVQTWTNCPASSLWPPKKPLFVAGKRHFTRGVDRDVSEPGSCQMPPVAGRSFDTTPAYSPLQGLVTSNAFLRENE